MLRKFLFAILIILPCAAQATVVLDWENNDRKWGESNVVNILTVVTNAGHSVNQGPIANLQNFGVVLLGEPNVALTAPEIAEIQAFVQGGGTLIVVTDSSCQGCANSNPVLAGIGSSINLSGSAGVLNPLPSEYFTDGPRAIAGLNLDVTPGTEVNGGTPLAGEYAAYEMLGSGLVVAFGDRSDYDGANPTDGSSVNSRLILNLLDLAQDGGGFYKPVPLFNGWSAFVLILLLAGAGIYNRRRQAT
jgi:hypothetical protein